MLRAITLMTLLVGFPLASQRPAQAAPKTVAIVNLSTAPAASDAASRVRELLDRSEGLRPTTPGDLARALEEALPQGGPEAQALNEAQAALDASAGAFTEFKSRQARTDLERARRILFGLRPNGKTTNLLADVSFHMALIHLREENLGLAMGELQLLHRLVDRKTIDPVRYPPDVVRAFDRARKQAKGKPTASVSISATYDGAPVYLDGVAAGPSPITLSMSAGAHIVSVAAPQYQATAILVDIDPGAEQSHRIDLKPRSQVLRAKELRFEAKSAGLRDEDLRMAAARVSRLVGSDAVMLIVNAATATGADAVATLYIQHLDRMTFRHKVDSGLKNMLGLVVEVPRPTLVAGVRQPGPVPWYKKPWALAAIGGGTALTIAGLLSLGTGDEVNQPRKGEPIFFPEP